MSRQTLEMWYHPAKKEVCFRRFQGKEEVPVRKDSRLQKYMEKERGRFVLQDHGAEFFDDIVKIFDGQDQIEIRTVATKSDFVDFQQMAEYYNAHTNGRGRITVTAGTALSDTEAYLSDMNQIYNNVRDYGVKAAKILDVMRHNFFNISTNQEMVKESIDTLAKDAQREIKNINEKVASLGDNNVNLCFVGVYSAGKSALINALLGYRILPENIKSKTARMFRIRSPKDSEPVSISFAISNEGARLVWYENKGTFEMVDGPSENDSTQQINHLLGEIKSKPLHEQIYDILNQLNDDPDVCSDVKIGFPIPLDSEKVQFTIYDTPGTDSNYDAHQETLRSALSEQTNSILIFVAAPDRLEGTGNHNLLSFIKEAGEKNKNTTIDMSRSLFVINRADTVEPEDRIELQTGEITDKEPDDETGGGDKNFSIKLSDKKLLFTSAKYAYASKAVKQGIATKKDQSVYTRALRASDDEDTGRYYEQNCCAHSQYATEHMIAQCGQALQKAQDSGNQPEIVHICSGLYALENEIRLYGEKYATAVRAYAIIDSVNQALSSMYKSADGFAEKSEEELLRITQDIENLRNKICNAVAEAVGKYAILNSGGIPAADLRQVGVDGQAYTEIKRKVQKAAKKRLKGTGFLRMGDPKSKRRAKQRLQADIKVILDKFTSNFIKERERHLTTLRNNAIWSAMEAVDRTGKLSPETKQFVCNICPPKIPAIDVSAIGTLYDGSTYEKNFLWMHTPYVDKEKFEGKMIEEVLKLWVELCNAYREDYCNAGNSIVRNIQDEFTKNLNKYSLILRAQLADKKFAEKLRDEIRQATERLVDCQQELNQRIWEVEDVGR